MTEGYAPALIEGMATSRRGAERDEQINIAYQRLGQPGGEPLLLIMGLGMQMIMWQDEFCAALAARGFTVARYDHRDTGASTHLHDAGRPTLARMMFRPSAAPYLVADMAGDAVAVMDALGWPSAHVAGISLGGMLAQELAIHHPDRVRSLTSIAATASARIGRLSFRLGLKLQRMQNRRVTNRDEAGQLMVDLFGLIGSPGYDMDQDWLREAGRQAYERGYDQSGRLRHEAAVVASKDRRPGLRGLAIPAVVIHGEADRVWRPAGGRATAEAIPGARLVTYPGFGHGLLPRALWLPVINDICGIAGL